MLKFIINNKISFVNFMLSTLVLFFLIESPSISMDQKGRRGKNTSYIAVPPERKINRNWKSSLDVYMGNNVIINNTEWLKSHLNLLFPILETTPHYIINLSGGKSTFTRNISYGRFTIFVKHFDGKISSFSSTLGSNLFISGCLFSPELSDYVISSVYFSDKKIESIHEINIEDITNSQKRKINEILGGPTMVSEGCTCSEASMLLYLDAEAIPKMINSYAEDFAGLEFEIIGTVFEIDSLNDPCKQKCLPMLNTLMQKMHEIINGKISVFKNISISKVLENMVLLTGHHAHEDSRGSGIINPNNEIIELNFEKPSNRIFSMMFDDKK